MEKKGMLEETRDNAGRKEKSRDKRILYL